MMTEFPFLGELTVKKSIEFIVYCQLKLNALSDNTYCLFSIQSSLNGHNQVPSYILPFLRSRYTRIYVTIGKKRDNLPKNDFHLLTQMLFQTCMTLSCTEHKRRYFEIFSLCM